MKEESRDPDTPGHGHPGPPPVAAHRQATYDTAVADFEHEVIWRVNAGLRGQDAATVHAALVEELHTRLPGVDLDDIDLWPVASAIADDALSEQLWSAHQPW